MVGKAYLFPGQGSQYVGMGKALQASPSSARLFKQAQAILNFDLLTLCLEGPQEELRRTQYSQVAIFVTSIAALALLSDEAPTLEPPQATCGLSLGEYSALVASGVLSFEEALRAVQERGRLMEEASQKAPGTLVAVFGTLEKIKALCQASGTEVANLNCPGQVVVSGRLQDIETFIALAQKEGIRRVFRLDVSGPFHSRFLKEAGEALGVFLQKLSFQKPKIPFISNVTGRFEEDPAIIRRNLVRQVSETVLWESSIRTLIARGIRHFFEIGPGNVLAGLNRKIDPTVETRHLESPEEVEAL